MLKKSFKPIFSPSRIKSKMTAKRDKEKEGSKALVPRPSRFGSTDATSANVKVCVRIRPPNDREIETNRRLVVKAIDKKMIIFDPKEDEDPFFYQGVQQPTHSYMKRANKELQFIFDNVFDMNATNVDVFNESTKDIINSLMEGYNCSVFVYGATGAGKTYTMLGYPENPGITYLTMQQLFVCIDLHRQDREFEICVSYLEIYNENVHDLLRPSGPLHIREDGKFGVQIAGLYTKSINTAQDLIDMLDKGNKNRTQHPTDANSESSRSHAVFQVYVKMRAKASNQAKIVKLSMIDLAGSERASATGCKGERFKEGANINRSLLALGNCINQLADGSKFIPYRDSKLTRLLKDSLGGNCRTVMIANIGPTSISYEDTYNTLKYATRANKIQQRMKKNIINCDNHVAQYVKQTEELLERVALLEAELAKAKEKESTSVLPVDDGEIRKWKARLESKANEHFSLIKKVLKKQKKQRKLAARAARKRRAAITLAALCGDVPDSQLKEACRKDISRLEMASNSLFQQTEILQDDLKPLIQQSIASENEFHSLKKTASEATKGIDSFVEGLNFQQKFIISHEKAEHLESIASLQQDEINKFNEFLKKSLETLKKNYIRLKSQGMFSSSMREEYNQLIREAKGSRAVTWEDNESMECDDAYFKYTVDIDPTSNKIIPQLPKESIIMSPFSALNKTEITNGTINRENVEDSKQDSVILIDDNDVNNLNETFTADSDAFLSDSLKMDHLKLPPKPIDPSILNSTFNVTEKLDGEPAAKKSFHKLPQHKFVLSERTNKLSIEKNGVIIKGIPTGKVTPFKKPTIINVNKENNKSGFGSSADRFNQAPNTPSAQGYKAVRGKERLALAGSSLPYSRPTVPKSAKKL